MSSCGESAIVCFDFKEMKIKITSYSIQSYYYQISYIKNWVIEVSDDGKTWVEIDSHQNSSDLNGNSFLKTYNVKENNFSRFCRFRHTGEYWLSSSLVISHIEFFGYIINSI